jgi:hypothetical protein
MTPVQMLTLAYVVLVLAVFILLWVDRGYYKRSVEQFAVVLVEIGEVRLSHSTLLKSMAEIKVHFDIASKEFEKIKTEFSVSKEWNNGRFDELYLAFSNSHKEILDAKKKLDEYSRPPVKIEIPPISIKVSRPPSRAVKPTKPAAPQSRVKSRVKEALKNSRGLEA